MGQGGFPQRAVLLDAGARLSQGAALWARAILSRAHFLGPCGLLPVALVVWLLALSPTLALSPSLTFTLFRLPIIGVRHEAHGGDVRAEGGGEE